MVFLNFMMIMAVGRQDRRLRHFQTVRSHDPDEARGIEAGHAKVIVPTENEIVFPWPENTENRSPARHITGAPGACRKAGDAAGDDSACLHACERQF
jgi:hypothetical protein